MATDGPAFDPRFLMYLDFLGTREAVKNWPAQKLREFVDLLRILVQSRTPEDIDGKPTEDGGYKITLQAAISTFSDHIVVSYPAPDYPELDPNQRIRAHWTEIVCKDCVRIASILSELALRQGMLLRGAISLGDMFHADEVVFGEALVDAYEMESTVAKAPRIVVSERVLGRIDGGANAHPDLFLQDALDKIWHLNYFHRMREYGVGAGGPESILRWNEAVRKIIAANLITLRDQPKPLEYWRWLTRKCVPFWLSNSDLGRRGLD